MFKKYFKSHETLRGCNISYLTGSQTGIPATALSVVSSNGDY